MSAPVEHLKVAGDVVAGSLVVAHVFQWAPLILALPAAIYACVRLYETRTFRKIIDFIKRKVRP